MNNISGLKPSLLWKYFFDITEIPRLSRKEEKIILYLQDFAGKNQIEIHTDRTGNVLMKKPASTGLEKRKTVILQSHMDMVGEKEQGVLHDFDNDPIIPVLDGEWIRAADTTLGADDGIGIAAQLVILSDNNLEHGPVECLFTVDEESGMTGAKNLEPGFFEGKILINLDSEDEGELFIGCAGGIDTIASYAINTVSPPPEAIAFRVAVSSLKGGHSGDEIHKSPANAIKIINRFLHNVSWKFDARLSLFEGGNLRNAIPREAFADFVVPRTKSRELETYFREYSKTVQDELKGFESGFTLDMQVCEFPRTILENTLQQSLLNALYACPHGVISWSFHLKGLVETSTNLASIRFTPDNKIIIVTSQRSSVDSAKTDIADRIASVFSLSGASVEHTEGYPGWTPDTDSQILDITRTAYKKLFGKEPVVRAIHAGLECGLILEKYPDLDMISFGPTIRGAHTPTERINIKTTEMFWKLLLQVMKNIPG